MNLTIIPFHDWRKNEKEGFRTRDSHLIKALYNNKKVNKVLVINRPTTLLELAYKKTSKKIIGRVIMKRKKFTLYEVDKNLYVVDFISGDIIGQATKKQKWFLDIYTHKGYTNFIKECWNKLSIDNTFLISQNIFAYKLALELPAKTKLFDAWDNFLKFPAYKSIKDELSKGYRMLAKESISWVTNSNENIIFFKTNYNVKKIELLKNGVKDDFATNYSTIPKDLNQIKRPIIGFGGKISYLLNVELINFLTKDNSEFSFVFVGQILDKNTFSAIEKNKNVYFLGDKHYTEYPNYVQNFDVCIIPYNTGKGQHGGDSLKAYEYLSTGKKVVGTKGNGLEDLKDYLYLAETAEEFSKELSTLSNEKPRMNIANYSWKSKALFLIKMLDETIT